MNRSACFILLALCVAYIPAAHAASLKDELLQNYKTRVLALRYPFVHGDQKFDSAGHPLSSPSGAWLVYGGIYIQNVVLSPNMLRLEGPRAALTRPKGNEKPLVVALGEDNIKVEISLDAPLNYIDEAQDVLNRVFYIEEEDPLLHARPEYRRSDADLDEPVYKVGNFGNFGNHLVKAPQATFTLEPEMSLRARKAQSTGIVVPKVALSIVVDKKGRVSRIRMEQPRGMDLDEIAVEAAKKWRFKPGTRDGEPVPVEMDIEVPFRLSNHL